eukprot:Hpha_TRINITY_DN14466_c1_g1::TRINITY_DN14466_c1_g1_i1::g.157275::m.157275/K02903/RP-L28e, RPL28; large subunit ribosomal protein L28e
MSSHLVWQITKKNNAFLRKQRKGRGGEKVTFSAEPLNLTKKASFRFSGLGVAPVGLELSEGKLTVERKQGTQVKAEPFKAVGKAAGARKDLRVTIKQRMARLKRVQARKQRKSWKA